MINLERKNPQVFSFMMKPPTFSVIYRAEIWLSKNEEKDKFSMFVN